MSDAIRKASEECAVEPITYPCIQCGREIEHKNDWCDKCWDRMQDDGCGIGWGT